MFRSVSSDQSKVPVLGTNDSKSLTVDKDV